MDLFWKGFGKVFEDGFGLSSIDFRSAFYELQTTHPRTKTNRNTAMHTHNYRECPTKIAARAHINLTEHYWVLMSAGVEVF